MATERVFEKDKVYLKDASGIIWNYEAALEGLTGFTAVVPNPSKPAEAKKEEEKKA
jgi:hypothetical protein